MTDYFVGPGGNNGNSGLTWALRKLTLMGAEGVGLASRDVVYVGPGVYREQWTIWSSGGNAYAIGTVTVTNGSATVMGAGTAFVANVSAGLDLFHMQFFASGNDGVANGTATFTSAAGNFQANMVGKVIQIAGRGAYAIGAVAAANSITLTDPNGLGWPAAAVGLSYSVMSGEGPYEIDSVTDNTNFELVKPWCGPTLTGLAYTTYGPIWLIADVTGENTDGVGGIVRVTGSNNDQTSARNDVIVGWTRSYRLYRGFFLSISGSNALVRLASSCTHITLEDCVLTDCETAGAYLHGPAQANLTLRRCLFFNNYTYDIRLYDGADVSDAGHLIENCLFTSAGAVVGIASYNIGGFTIKNCAFFNGVYAVQIDAALAVGQTITTNNCLLRAITGLGATAVGEITEDYNSFWNCGADRVNTAVGANSISYPPLFQPPILHDGYKFPWWFGELAEWSEVRAIAGAFEACGDLRGLRRPVTSAKKSWGPLQFTDMERDTGTVYAGAASMELLDAGRIQVKTPTTDRRYTVRAWVYREADYAGTNPQLIVKQPGQADRITTDAGAAGAWNLLEDSFVPAALPPYLFVELVSNNTAVAGNYATYFDRLTVRGSPLDTGEMEQWLWDRQPFEDYGKVTPVVKKSAQGDEVFVEINTRGDLLKVAP